MKYQGYDKKIVVHQRILAVIALAGLFACGLMVGLGVTKTKTIVQKIETVAHNVTTKDSLPDKTCSAVEKVLEAKLYKETDTTSCREFWDNQHVYSDLVNRCCPENQDKYRALQDRNTELISASCSEEEIQQIQQEYRYRVDDTKSTCVAVRDEMLNMVYQGAHDYASHIDNAKIYAIIAERGCAKEAEYYKDLAEKELAVARAITDDKLSEQDTIEVVETYKKLQMQAAAQEVFEKAKRLTNPAIDFILEVEKIINE